MKSPCRVPLLQVLPPSSRPVLRRMALMLAVPGVLMASVAPGQALDESGLKQIVHRLAASTMLPGVRLFVMDKVTIHSEVPDESR